MLHDILLWPFVFDGMAGEPGLHEMRIDVPRYRALDLPRCRTPHVARDKLHPTTIPPPDTIECTLA